ncbi:MAG: imidazole glycerol phosphate synthase subunit HisH [Planctomycetes bacterium]|nr:imidazole glycerol phosphate synthase subunit HisH [Planctomycetota bacterium]
MKSVTILDFSMGNLRSVQKAFEAVGASARIVRTPEEAAGAERLVVPGVGAFGDAIRALSASGLDRAIQAHAASGRPLLGICLGLQILFDVGLEGGRRPGLGILAGEVVRFPEDLAHEGKRLKVPHVGWNRLRPARGSGFLAGLEAEPYVYFVHSYYVRPVDPGVVVATTDYGIEFCSAVSSRNVHATQFHPEKSQRVGARILENFLGL